MSKKYFVVADVHSFFIELQTALGKRGFDIADPDHNLIICGDLFDRGPGSKELLEFVKSLGDRFIYVKGNHEDLLEDCVADLVAGRSIGQHHFGNGTVQTIADICDVEYWDIAASRRPESVNQLVYTRTRPLLDFISTKSKNYLELGRYIFVHGWVPTIDPNLSYSDRKPLTLASREWWDDQESYEARDIWKEARWTNGMQAWKDGCTIPDKTIICGHWHCSWGWSHLRQERKEFPNKSLQDWQKSFEPFVDEGIIALDGCTAYSGIVNCIVLEENSSGDVQFLA